MTPQNRNTHHSPPHRRGFTLIEMSLVLVVMGIVLMGVFPAFSALRQNMQMTATQNNMQTVLRATAAFAQSQGCLPCPTPPLATGSKFGKIAGNATGPLCGTCTDPEGLVPFIALGLPMAMAKDGWGRWLTMRIDPALATNATKIVPPTTPCTPTDVTTGLCAVATASQKGLCKANLSAANTHPLVQLQSGPSQNAALVLVSHGPNGYGSFLASPRSSGVTVIQRLGVEDGTTPTCADGPESCNASFSRQFIEADHSDTYDDLLLQTDRNALISLLGQGSCHTTW